MAKVQVSDVVEENIGDIRPRTQEVTAWLPEGIWALDADPGDYDGYVRPALDDPRWVRPNIT